MILQMTDYLMVCKTCQIGLQFGTFCNAKDTVLGGKRYCFAA